MKQFAQEMNALCDPEPSAMTKSRSFLSGISQVCKPDPAAD
jgi:hypothetical protein